MTGRLLVLPYLFFAKPTPVLLMVGGSLALLGVLLRGWAAGHLSKEEVLCTSGPYALTRNPLYLGSFWIGTGFTVSGGHILFVVLFLLFFGWIYVRTMRCEEAILRANFGEAFERWRRDVPLFLPKVRPSLAWNAGEPGAFGLDRYLRNCEWKAFLGVMVGFGFLVGKMFWTA